MPQKTAEDRREYQRRYYRANMEKAKEYQREYNRTHKYSCRKPRKGKKDVYRAAQEVYNLPKLACVVPEKFPAAFDRYISSVLGCK